MAAVSRSESPAAKVARTCSPTTELYNEAYAIVDQGICCDEVGFARGALDLYKKGVQLIDQAAKLPNSSENEMCRKMARAKLHILSRLNDLEKSTTGESTNDGSYELPLEAICNTMCSLGDAKNAQELLVISDGVQIFFMKGDETTVPSYPSFLRIFKFDPNGGSGEKSGTKTVPPKSAEKTAQISPAFLQVSDWIYPLAPNKSPVFHSTYGAYIFPNPSVDEPDSFVGVILPKDLDAALLTRFRDLMKEHAALKEAENPPALTPQETERLASRISNFLLNSSEYVVHHLKRGSDMTSDFIRKQSDTIKDRTGYRTKNVTIDPRVQTSVHYLRQGTKITVKISGYLVSKIGALGAVIGKRLATSVDKRLQSNSAGAQTLHDVLQVTTAGVTGASTIWVALEEVSKKLARCIANETVTVVNHTYGTQAGDVTNDVLYSAGFAALTAWNVECLGMQGIARRSAKSASLAFLQDFGGPESSGQKSTEQKVPDAPKVEEKDTHSKRLKKL